MLKTISNRLVKYFFLILFLGFFGSTTLFNHAHIVNGVTIIHSHPFKSDTNGLPLHRHSSEGYLLIHILNDFASVITCTLFAVTVLNLLREKICLKSVYNFFRQPLMDTSPLRGPPALINN